MKKRLMLIIYEVKKTNNNFHTLWTCKSADQFKKVMLESTRASVDGVMRNVSVNVMTLTEAIEALEKVNNTKVTLYTHESFADYNANSIPEIPSLVRFQAKLLGWL